MQNFCLHTSKMSRIYKLCITNDYDREPIRMIAIKPKSDSFKSFQEEIFTRFPDLDKETLEMFYEDKDSDKVTIIVPQDFDLFKEHRIDKVFAVISNFYSLSCYVNEDTTSSQESGSTDDVKAEGTEGSELGTKSVDASDASNGYPTTTPSALSDEPPAKRQKINKNDKRKRFR